MAWKVQDKTNAVEEAQLTSTIVGAGGCVMFPHQEWAWVAEL